MDARLEQKTRLHQLINLACVHRGWSKAELSRRLKRDPTKLYPESGNPKMDFVVALADVLAWSIDDVVSYVRNGNGTSGTYGLDDYEALDQVAREAHQAGEYVKMVELAREMYAVARTPEERARACNREHGGWDGLGRYTKALEAVCRGLREEALPTRRRLQLQTNLANTHYTLWELSAAHAHSHVVLEWYLANPPTEVIDRKNLAFAYFVRGHAYRRRAMRDPDQQIWCCRSAKSDLDTAYEMYTALAAELADDRLAGIANTCDGGRIEAQVGLGERDALAATEELWDRLQPVEDGREWPTGDWLESHGWCSIIGANIALQHLRGREQDQALGKFTNKALDIADRLDNWALRERVFEMDFRLHRVQCEATELDLPYTIDQEDLKLIVGTMGRFPMFHETGWEILRTAKVVSDVQRK